MISNRYYASPNPVLPVVILTIPSGCTQKKKISGKAFIPQEKLVDVLVDIHLVDGITNDRKFYRRYEEVDSIDLLGPILEKHQDQQANV